jgi:hypothetical protein
MSRAVRIPRAEIQPPAQSAASSNVVATIFNRHGDLEPLVARRNGVRNIERIADLRAEEGDRNRALERLERLPSEEALVAELASLRSAVFEPASEPDLRVIVSVMLEALPAAKAQATAVYIDAVVWALQHADDDRTREAFPPFRGFSARVLATVTRRIWFKNTFAPSIAELLATAREVRAEYWCATGATNRLLALRRNAEAVIAALPPPPSSLEGDPEDIPF